MSNNTTYGWRQTVPMQSWKLQAEMWKYRRRKTNGMSDTGSVVIQAVCLNEYNSITVSWGKDSCNSLLLQSVPCKTLLEVELLLICGNIFEGSIKCP